MGLHLAPKEEVMTQQDRDVASDFTPSELKEVWALLSTPERVDGFHYLTRPDGEEFFLGLDAYNQAELLLALPENERRSWIRLLPPDDAADVIQQVSPDQRPRLLTLLDEPFRKEVTALMAYAEDDAGGLMNPLFARIRPDMSVDEAIAYLRKQTGHVENIYYGYVLDAQQHLLGVVSFRELISARGDIQVKDLMHTEVIKVPENMDQEALSQLFAQHDLLAIPVVDHENQMKGIVTFDDIVDVVQEEATEDIQKIGGTEALEAPYLQVGLPQMLRKRAGWLSILFLGELLTASAMGYFEGQIERAVVLAIFIPLIISSGGNSGSQASTLVIRALALKEVRLQDWWRVIGRELVSGLSLGLILGAMGLLRVLIWPTQAQGAWDHHLGIALTVSLSLVGVVLWGTIVGSMLPFMLRRFGFDPASASAPLVATIVDVTGLVIYFSAASAFLSGTLL